QAKSEAYPNAELLIHPECGCTAQSVYAAQCGLLPAESTQVLSTEGMVRRAQTSSADTFLIATETGLLHRLEKGSPGKLFMAGDEGAVCRYMKQITLPKLRDTLRDFSPTVEVDPEIASRARLAIDRMLAVRV